MSIAEKLTTVAENVPKVYEAGKNAMLELHPETTVSGSYISVDNVSELPHNVECTVSGVADPTNVTVTRCGANLVCFPKIWSGTSSGISSVVNDDGSIVVNGTATSLRQFISNEITWFANTDVAVTVSFAESSKSGVQASITPYDENGVNLGVNYLTSSKQVTIPSNCRKISVSLYITQGTTVENYMIYPMLNIGTTAQPYEPYNGQTFTPNADGTVEGMTSVSPYMNIFTDNADTILDVTYRVSKGIQTEYDRFWDSHPTAKGYTSGENLFSGAGWNDTTFKPKYDIIIGNGYMLFKACAVTDLVARLNECGVVFDTSNVNTLYFAFSASKITHVGELSLLHNNFATLTTGTTSMFSHCYYLHTIDKIIVNSEGTTKFANDMFASATVLANVTFEGVIGNTINFSSSPLTLASAQSVLNALKNYAGTENEFKNTVTFSSTTKTLLNNAGAIFNGMTWGDYLLSIGWTA